MTGHAWAWLRWPWWHGHRDRVEDARRDTEARSACEEATRKLDFVRGEHQRIIDDLAAGPDRAVDRFGRKFGREVRRRRNGAAN